MYIGGSEGDDDSVRSNVIHDNVQDANDRIDSQDLKNMLSIMLNLLNNVLYKCIIEDLAEYPFSIIFWPREANELIERLDIDQTFIFGTAGRLSKNFHVPDSYTSGDLISYILGYESDKSFIPLFQICTEENTKSIFERFLTETMRDGFKMPAKIVIDYLVYVCEAVCSGDFH